jgi:hypothetical protein
VCYCPDTTVVWVPYLGKRWAKKRQLRAARKARKEITPEVQVVILP